MKILYVGGERSDAQAVATALRGIAQNGKVSWTSHLDHAARWIDQNADLAAMVVEAGIDQTNWRQVIGQVRSLASHPPVVVVTPHGLGGQFESHELEADEYLTKNEFLMRDLVNVLKRSIDRDPMHQSTPPPGTGPESRQRETQLQALVDLERAARGDLEEKLAHARTTLQEAEERHRSEMARATEQLAKQQAQYEIGMARADAQWEMVDEQLREAAIQVERARRDQATAVATADELSRREAELSSLVAEARAARVALEHRLNDAEAALAALNARAADERRAAAEQLNAQQRELEARIAGEIEKRNGVEERLAETISERDKAEKAHASAIADVVGQLSTVEASLRQSQEDLETRAAAVEGLTKREAELTSMLADASASRNDLERRLAATEAAFDDAGARATRERLAAAKKAADREAELDGQIQQERTARSALEQAVADTEAALRDVNQRHAAALAESARETTERQAQFDRELTQTAAARDSLSAQLAEAVKTIACAGDRALNLEARIQDERATNATLDQALAAAEAVLLDARQRHESALAASAKELADRQAQFDREIAQTTAAHDSLAQRLIETEAALDQMRRERQSASADVDRLTEREADLNAQLANVQAASDTFERRLIEAITAIAEADERAAREHATAATREADIEARLAHTLDIRNALEQTLIETESTLAETRSAALEAKRSLTEEIDVLRAEGVEQAAQFEARITEARREHETRLAEKEDLNGHLKREREVLQQLLAASEAQLRRLGNEHHEACERFDQDRLAADEDIRRLTAERAGVEQELEDARKAFQEEQDRRSGEHAGALTALDDTIAARDRQLEEQAAQHASSQQAAEAARTEMQQHFDDKLAARDHEIEELRGQLRTVNQSLGSAKQREQQLQARADQIPQLLTQLDASRGENHRLFQLAPLPIFRCNRDGAMTQANRAWTTLVRRKIDELRGTDVASAVFESPGDLSWLIEQCLSTRSKESIETTVRRKDGARLFVRLWAFASTPDDVEIAAEDLTRIRVLQDRLTQAGRMEAVGRLASEVALNCAKLLNDTQQRARQLLTGSGDNGADRQQRHALVDELTRVTGYLRQLVAYGDKQSRTPALADLGVMMRDLAPVLKHVAGADVDVQLPSASTPLNVDVESERVERLLVNLAAYGRGRMPFGGRLTIELGTAVVDRGFTAKYPNVRPGPHALITVTEARRRARADGVTPLREGAAAPAAHIGGMSKPGVDLATLQGLVGECGGHLWLKLQPLGDIVAKIRLPLHTSYDQKSAPASALSARGGRTRTLARWFQH
jgi:hypothetical protein